MLALLVALAQPPQPLPPSVTDNLRPVDPRLFSARPQGGSWQLVHQGTVVRDFGPDSFLAGEALRAVRDLMPTQWGDIGTSPVVGYALTNGQPFEPKMPPKNSRPIDLRSARAEQVRGAWCVRDDANILLNFGPARADAAQVVAVAQKYGFNRLADVGQPPALTYLYYSNAGTPPPAVDPKLTAAVQEQALTRTGIEVPGVGYVGERLAINWQKVEHRKDRADWVVAHGPDVLARVGASEWVARDAVRMVQAYRYTEFCRFGTEGVTFFLKNGKAPTDVPYQTQGQRFDPAGLKVREVGGKWWACDAGGRPVLPAGSATEAEQLVKLVRGFGFDMVCQIGTGPRATLKFLAKAK